MIIVYGADWCEDTQRSLRHLRRLAVPHQYVNIDEDLDALDRAKALNGGTAANADHRSRASAAPPLVEPDNDALTGALVERDMLTDDEVTERLAVQNVGDFERVLAHARRRARCCSRAAGSRRPRAGLSRSRAAYGRGFRR